MVRLAFREPLPFVRPCRRPIVAKVLSMGRSSAGRPKCPVGKSYQAKWVFRSFERLLPGGGIDLSECGPKAKGSIADGQLRLLREPPLVEIEEQFLPVMFSLTDAVHDGDQFLPAFGRGSHQAEQALLLIARVFPAAL